jgi:hypothetical protein
MRKFGEIRAKKIDKKSENLNGKSIKLLHNVDGSVVLELND